MENWTMQTQLKGHMVMPGQDIRLGMGYDSADKDTRALAVKDDEIFKDAASQDVKGTVSKIETLHELREALEISTSASYSGLFSVSAKADWSRETEIKEQYVYLLVSIKVTSGIEKLKAPYKLTDEARKAVVDEQIDWTAFQSRYGDTFIESIIYGGEFYILYEFQTRSASEKQQLITKLEGSYGAFSASAEVKRRVESIQVNTKTAVSYFIQGGGGKLPDIKPENILEAFLKFPEAVKLDGGAPALMSATYKDYQVVDDFPTVPELNDSLQVIDQLNHLEDEINTDLKDIPFDLIPEVKKMADDLKGRIDSHRKQIQHNPLRGSQFPVELEQDYKAKIAPLNAWCPRGEGLEKNNIANISVANGEYILAVDSERKTYRWDRGGEKWIWTGGGREIMVTATTNSMCVAINKDNEIWWGFNGEYRSKLFAGVGANYWTGSDWAVNPPNDYTFQVTISATDDPSLQENYYKVSKTGRLYRYYRGGNSWEEVVRVVEDNAETALWGKFRSITGDIKRFPDLKSVSVGSNDYNVICVIADDKENTVYKLVMDERTGTGKIHILPVKLKQVSVCDTDDIWGINTNDHVVRWTGSAWLEIPVPVRFKWISVGQGRAVWGVTEYGQPVQMKGEYWLARDGDHDLPFDPSVISLYVE